METNVTTSTLEQSAAAATNPATKRAIIALGDKGGSSKSFLTRRLYEAHLGSHTSLLGIDADATVGHLVKHYGADHITAFDLHSADLDEREYLTNTLLRESNAALVIIDFPATSLNTLLKMKEDGIDFVREVSNAGYRPTILAPITPYDDTLFDLRKAIELFDPESVELFEKLGAVGKGGVKIASAIKTVALNADYVAIVNLGMAEDRSDFDLWDESEARRLLQFIGGTEFDFPRLRPRIAARIAQHSSSFGDAMKANYIKPTDKSRLATWLDQSEAALRKAGPLLGF